MTAADPQKANRTQLGAGLEETFVLLDNSSGRGAPSLLFSEPVEIISASTPEEVPAALARLEAGTASGLHAAGFFAYELGYVLEPKIRRRERSCRAGRSSPCVANARTSVGEMPRTSTPCEAQNSHIRSASG